MPCPTPSSFAYPVGRLLLRLLCAWLLLQCGAAQALQSDLVWIEVRELPPEARETLAMIKRGGPYAYRKDDSVFGNRERQLPGQRHGYYREFTVKTPGSRDRGARRIIAGGVGEYYYTSDHYRTFRRIRE